MKIIILGAGITGLSIGKMLNEFHDVKILEKDHTIGGIAKTKIINGVPYHLVGGHCFNSKYKEVLDFVFSCLPIEKWHKIQRVSRISLENYEVDYPIEFSIKQIYEKDKELAFKITKDLFSSRDNYSYKNLEDWFIKKFGHTLAKLYFIPYNSKIWATHPSLMSSEWVTDKLPIPNKRIFFDGLFDAQSDKMPHVSFYYPNNYEKTLINQMAEGLIIETNTNVKKISRSSTGWLINNRYRADLIISTIPLNIIPKLISTCPAEILNLAKLLKYNKVSNMLWESKSTEKTWTYKPISDTIFHRYIHVGNFIKPNKNYTITEAIGEFSFDELEKWGQMDPFLLKPIDYNISDHAYVLFDENRQMAVNKILNYLNKEDLISIGRFGQWDYYNMDVCIKKCLDVCTRILKKEAK